MRFILFIERVFSERFAYIVQRQLGKSVGRHPEDKMIYLSESEYNLYH